MVFNFLRPSAIFSLCMLIFFSDLPLVCAEQTGAGQPAFEQAVELRKTGKLEEAERYFMKALETDPDNPDYHFELANVYAAWFDQWKDPQHPMAQAMLDKAAHEFQEAVMFRPDFVAANYNLGVIFKKRREYEKARECFRRVIALDNQSVAARMQIGAIYEEQGFFDEAKDVYKEAQEFDYNNPEIKGVIEELETHRVERAEAERLNPDVLGRLGGLNRNFSYAAFGHAEQQERESQAGMNAAGGVSQAVPVLAAMLVQQLMTRFRGKKDDEPALAQGDE